MNDVIDRTHFKTMDHFKDHVLAKYPNASDQELRELYSQRVKDPSVRKKVIRKYHIKIFTSSLYSWFRDLFNNPCCEFPYFHLFIATNNRYTEAIPIQNKNAETINKSLQMFLEKH